MSEGRFALSGLATAIGSMPHLDSKGACSLVLKYLPEIPAWPQLPKRSFLENMYVQFSKGLPGVLIEGDRIWVDCSLDLSKELEQLYTDELQNNLERYAIGPDRAKGLHTFLRGVFSPLAVKGQVTGPISLGLTITDRNQRPLLYNDVVADAIARHLKLKAAWQERALKAVSPNTIIFVDEPYLASIGSAFVSVPREQVLGLIEKVFEGITGLKGIHCCGNTDWSLVLETSLDILSFDAYSYGKTLSLYPAEVKSFLARGGVVAWGIVPSDEQALAGETVASLKDRLEETMGLFCKKGIGYDTLVHRSLVTPSCGLGSLSIEAAERALELLSELSAKLRSKGDFVS